MKKTEILSTAITKETKAKLEQLAQEKEWTLSHLVNKILEEYNEPKQNQKNNKE